MKLLSITVVFYALLPIFLNSCVKDLGSYTYSDVNEAVIEGIDSLYVIEMDKIVKINPRVNFTNDPSPDLTNYKFEWFRLRLKTMSTRVPEKISDSINFDNTIITPFGLGKYEYCFRVTDLRTGVYKQKNFDIVVSNDIYEGWYILSQVDDDMSRLDMLSYKFMEKNFVMMEDVLKMKNSTAKLDGLPSFLSFNHSSSISVATSKVARRIDFEDLTHFILPEFNNFPSKKNEAIGVNAKLYGKAGQLYLTNNNKVYTLYTLSQVYKQMNFDKDNVEFKANPYISFFNPTDAFVFNEDRSEFMISRGAGSTSFSEKIEIQTLHNYTHNRELLFLKYVAFNSGETFAILRDKLNSKIYLLRFNSGLQRINIEEIQQTQINSAEHYEVNDEYGYIFYSVGGKLYEYDVNNKVNKMMADYGENKISMLKFQKIDPFKINDSERLLNISQRLCIGVYNPKIDMAKSGIFDIYAVPARGEQIVKEQSYSGFGKIRDVTYIER